MIFDGNKNVFAIIHILLRPINAEWTESVGSEKRMTPPKSGLLWMRSVFLMRKPIHSASYNRTEEKRRDILILSHRKRKRER